MEQSSSVLGAALQRAAQCSGWARREMLAGEAMANRNQARAALTIPYTVADETRFFGALQGGCRSAARAPHNTHHNHPPRRRLAGLHIRCVPKLCSMTRKKKLDPWRGRSLD